MTGKQARLSPADLHQQIRTQGSRETVETIVVAIILALLFRSFVAEAFVIPTGSMAPALMGAHKDLNCLECGHPYQVGASIETDTASHEEAVIASFCPNCRHLNPIDLANKPNDETFAGDRILVSKFAYALAEPERWDVIVFKFPGNPKQNYIKRLVGLPDETLRIRYGDLYSKPNGSDDFGILRKDHTKLLAMSQTVSDTMYQPKTLVAADYPSNWQPWAPGAAQPPTDSWQIIRNADQWKTELTAATDQWQLLRYYHRCADEVEWQGAKEGIPLTSIDPYSSVAITDFYPYDSYTYVDAEKVYEIPPGLPPRSTGFFEGLFYRFGAYPGELRDDYKPGVGPEQFRSGVNFGKSEIAQYGNHWVGDLIFEADFEAANEQGELLFELVESAVVFRCYIRLSDGQARLEINDIEGPISFQQAGGKATAEPTAKTSIRAGQRHSVRFANCDDQLYLWVDNSPITFDQPTSYNMATIRPLDEQRPYTDSEHPFDAAPIAFGARGTTATTYRCKVDRDKYYIAVDGNTRGGLKDYEFASGNFVTDFKRVLLTPSLWDSSRLWAARRTVEFTLDVDQFFPMGDNSPESSDARCWVRGDNRYSGIASRNNSDAYIYADAHFVPRDLLVGKAIMVFWPHTWNSPVPFTPNFKRIGFIR